MLRVRRITTEMLAATTKRSDLPKRQRFIEPGTEADSPLTPQFVPFLVAPKFGRPKSKRECAIAVEHISDLVPASR